MESKASPQDVLEFQDRMGNLLSILGLQYKRATATGIYPKVELREMANSAREIYISLCRFIRQSYPDKLIGG